MEKIYKGDIIVLTLERFPDGDASSNRLKALLITIDLCGYQCIVIGNGSRFSENKTKWKEIEGRNIKYLSIRSKKDTVFNKIFTRIFSPIILLYYCNKYKNKNTKLIITTHTTISSPIFLISKYIWNLPLIVECSEWHERNQYTGPLGIFKYINFCFNFHILCPATRNIICISNALLKKFQSTNNKVVIPPTYDPNDFKNLTSSYEKSEVLNIFYGGNISGKDDVATLIKGILLLKKSDQEKIQFTIAGPTKEKLFEYLSRSGIELNKIKTFVNPIGRISKKETIEYLTKSDFSILLRPITRYSTAGFPSKVIESLAAGTPVITNITSDLGRYLQDGVDCIIIKEYSEASVASALIRALNLNEAEHNKLKTNSQKTAIKKFSPKSYVENIKFFLENIK